MAPTDRDSLVDTVRFLPTPSYKIRSGDDPVRNVFRPDQWEAPRWPLKDSWVDGGSAANEGSGKLENPRTTIREEKHQISGDGASRSCGKPKSIHDAVAREHT